MDFSLSDDQRLLKESAERFIMRDYPFEKRRANAALREGFSRDTWAAFADLGWLGAALPEAYGGSGGSAVETMVLMEELGRGLVVEPLLATAILGGGLILGGFSPSEAIAELGPRILYVHAHDCVRDVAAGRGIEVPLGRGSADFPELAGMLEQHQYQGFFTIDPSGGEDPAGEISQAVQFVRSL